MCVMCVMCVTMLMVTLRTSSYKRSMWFECVDTVGIAGDVNVGASFLAHIFNTLSISHTIFGAVMVAVVLVVPLLWFAIVC
jgi:hypothetical protein